MKKLWLSLVALIGVWSFWHYSLFAADANVAGDAPTQNVDGTPLTDLHHINLYKKVNAGTYALKATIPFTTAGGHFTYLDSNIANGTSCYQATAVDTAGNESMVSNEACKTVDVLFPKNPTGLSAL